MTILTILFLALIGGASGILLLSGDGHLMLFEKLFGVSELPFNYLYLAVILHAGNLLAVLVTERRELLSLGQELLRALHLRKTTRRDRQRPPLSRRVLFLYTVSLLPMPLSLLFFRTVHSVYTLESALLLVGLGLLLSGLALFLSERLYRGSKDEKNMTPLDALLIGLAQVPTVFPGLSRAGLTASVGVMRGLKREYAVRYSHLLSVPVLLAALIAESIAAGGMGLQMPSVWLCLLGVAASTGVSLLALRLLRHIARYGRLDNLSYWCWGTAILSCLLVLIA